MKAPRWFLRIISLTALAAVLIPMKMGCQQQPTPSTRGPVGTQSMAIINGTGDLSQPAIGALVIRRGSSFCTGTLITKQLVVTAAHCVDAINRYGLRNVQFRTDFTDPNLKFRSEHHELLQVATHPQYRAGAGADYDVAVLVLQNKAANVTPIPANRNPMDPKWVGTNIKVVGYGLIETRPNNRSADQKYMAEIPLFQIGTRSFIHFDDKTPVAQRKSACHGDSGGPALYTSGSRQYVMGVTSIAYQATPKSGGTYCDGGAVSTRLDSALDFLRPFLTKYSDGPQACVADTDCGPCSECGTTKICAPKTFAVEPAQCKPCKADADCGTGICYRFPTGFRCLQACTKDSCCPTGTACNTLGGTNLTIAACTPEKDSCPATACTADAECGPGEKCDTGTCKPNPPPRSPELCHPCKTNADCGTNGFCYGPAGNGRCTQPCGDGGFCPDGFGCSSLYPGVPAQCVPDDGTCRVPCLTNDHCPSGFACANKFCGRIGGGIHGDSCDPMPCVTGLTCVSTASGKNCLKQCGIKPGYGGRACLANQQCLGGARCFTSGDTSFCLAGCTPNGSECGTKGGGTCSASGNCLCRDATECRNGYTCNLFTYDRGGPVGACVPLAGDRPCDSGFECRSFTAGEYCVATGAGVRSIGEQCDSLNRCKDGLLCLNTTSGQTCFEDCTQSRTCKLGGSCLQIGRTTRLCLCTNNLGCPKDRICQSAFQGYGVCRPKAQSTPVECIDDKECPLYHTCKAGTCEQGPIPKPEPKPEPTAEPTAEPIVDAGAPEPPTKAEPPVTPDDTAKPEPPVTKDVAPVAEKATPEALKPAGGCGCSSTLPAQGPGQLPLSLLLLFLFLGFSWRTRSPR